MPNTWFKFKEFTIQQGKTAMKVGTDGVLLGAWADFSSADKILDIGSGTGLISLMAAQRTNAEIYAIEFEENAFKQTVENIEISKYNKRIKAYNVSLQLYSEETTIKFDHIVCNPPFFSNSLKPDNKARNIARHDNTLPFSDLISGVKRIIHKEGKFSLILPVEKKIEFISLAEKLDLYCNRLTMVKPNFNKAIKRVLFEFSLRKTETKESELIIETDKRHSYTREYIELTRDFYLNM